MTIDTDFEQTSDDLGSLLTVADVARFLQLSDQAVRRIFRNGDGPRTYKVGGTIRVYPADLHEWIKSGAAAEARTTRGYRVPAKK